MWIEFYSVNPQLFKNYKFHFKNEETGPQSGKTISGEYICDLPGSAPGVNNSKFCAPSTGPATLNGESNDEWW